MGITMTYDKVTAIRIRDFLLSKGLTLEGAYGMMANIYAESGFRSNNAQNSYMIKMGMTDEVYTNQVDRGKYTSFCVDRVGYGLCQWTSSGRKTGLFNYADSQGISIGDEQMQLEYLMTELSTAYKSVLKFLKSSYDIRESAKRVMLDFERPADKSESNQNKRADYGEQLHKELENIKEVDNMSNSGLISYTKISPNKTVNRNHKIDTITIHCVVGQVTVERLGEIFAPVSRKASANYGIGKDGKIGMYVEEKDRSWCSSNAANDHRAITIEVASDTKHPYAVTDAAMKSLIRLCADICKRNGIEKLVWSTNKNDRVKHLNGCNMTVHRDFAAKACPGDYLYERHGYIADEVNKLLAPAKEEPKIEEATDSKTMYQVIAGTFKSKGNAETRMKELKAKGIDCYVQKK